jgi:hypothetical protein
MKTEIILCDVCNDKIARHKCEICEKDMCADCRDVLSTETAGTRSFSSTILLLTTEVCRTCASKIRCDNKVDSSGYVSKKGSRMYNSPEVKRAVLTALKNEVGLTELEK